MIKAKRTAGVFIFVSLIFLSTGLVSAQERKVNINALLEETQLMSEGSDDITMVWWIPEEFWQISFSQDPSLNPAEAEEFMRVLRPYTIIVAVEGLIGTFGGVTYKSEDYLRENTFIKDNRGNTFVPLPKNKIDADTWSLLSTMKPVLVNILGPMGENMHFLLFPADDAGGRTIADPKSEGIFTVSLDQQLFKYRLPLGSLLPPKKCPVDGEELNGAWKYCPWHGTELK